MTQQELIKRDIKKLQQSKQLLAILILLFVALLFWIIVSLISSQTTEKISAELQKLAKPLTPVIDTKVLERITAKRKYSNEELSSFAIYKVVVSKDGRTERVVPLEFTVDDLEQKPNLPSNKSLLQEETQEDHVRSEPTIQPSARPTTQPSTQPTRSESNLGEQL